ncbi:hypothetical protein D9M71_596000 [compost metagenome]
MFAQVEQGAPGDLPGQCLSLLQSALQAGLRQVGGGRVGFHAIEAHGEHCAFVAAEERRLGDILAHRQVLLALLHITQGEKFATAAQGGEALAQQCGQLEHAGTSVCAVVPPQNHSSCMLRQVSSRAASNASSLWQPGTSQVRK